MNKSIGANLKYIQKIEEQQQLIEQLKKSYKEKTGFDPPDFSKDDKLEKTQLLEGSIILKQTKSLFLQSQIEQQKQEMQDFETFYDAVAALQLPTKIIPQKNKIIRNNYKTNIDLKNPFHVIEKIDLSGFVFKKFNRLAFKEFLESLQDMRTLNCLILRNNGIDDSYFEELKYIITNTHIQNLDLSQNEISSKGIEAFILQLKEVTYFKSIDLTRNNFSNNMSTLNSLCSALSKQTELFHVGLDAYKTNTPDYRGIDVILKFIINNKQIKSAIIQDSHIHDISKLSNSLQTTSNLTQLTLKFCFLTNNHIKQLCDSLQTNQTLVSLNLQQNALSDVAGGYITQLIYYNNVLYSLDLEHNSLGNEFIRKLAEVLKRNNVISVCKLGYNSISDIRPLLKVIGPENNSITDLGNLQQNPIDLAQVEQIKKRLKAENYHDYNLLKPIHFNDSLHRTQDKYRVWNI